MLTVDITASSRYPISRPKIKKTIEQVLKKMKISGDIEVELQIIGDRKMTQLHKKHLKEPGTTDVLSFPLQENYIFNQQKKDKEFIDFPDDKLRLGSIVISYPQARHQANDHNILVNEEINRLVEHSMLHLLGVHHE
jgi:probable rRNA maturation factor